MTTQDEGRSAPDLLAQEPARLKEIESRAMLRRCQEGHRGIEVHEAIDGAVVEGARVLHEICAECSDVDVVEALENGDLIDASAGAIYPCAAADVEWLLGFLGRVS